MKNVLKKSVVAVAIMVTSFNFAQTTKTTTKPEIKDTRENFKIGLKGGANLSNIYDEQDQNYAAEKKYGFFAGAFLSIPLSKYFGIQPEVVYSQKGFKANGNVLGVGYQFTRTSNYLDIPLLIQVKPTECITLVGGPQFSYLLETKNEFNGSTNTIQEDGINSQNYKKNIFGIAVGIDFNIDNFIITTRGGWDVTKSDSNGNTTNPRYKNQVLQLGIGYTF
ncbi:MAG: PorT family protein [Flavobacterium sp.]|nr:PorT family protein [Flavobacterium sp.]